MPITLTTRARDSNPAVMHIEFRDAAGNAVTPTSAAWTLTNAAGTVVNSRSAVAIAPLDSAVDITFLSADTEYADGPMRRMLVEWVYTSTEGSDLEASETITFWIRDLRGV